MAFSTKSFLLKLLRLLAYISATCGYLSCSEPRGRLSASSSFDPPSTALLCTTSSDESAEGHDDWLINTPFTTMDPSLDRRTLVSSLLVTSATTSLALPSKAVEPSTSVRDLITGQGDMPLLETGLLESRVLENVMSPPPYAMEGSDVFYPEWFAGTWNVKSLTTDVQAPCGVMLFGGNATYDRARKEIGTFLNYESRFISDGSGRTVVADREFNVKSIAKVAMGANSVVDVSTATPNKFSCLLSPMGSPSMLTVDLIVLNRRQENVDANNFHCTEVVREIVSPVGQTGTPARPQSPLLKEIETTSLYRLVSPTEVQCIQRSATFLLPSQQDPMALKMWELSRNRPIDVRFYDVRYTKR